jgi:DNA-binding NarL/FixJ family response regulator
MPSGVTDSTKIMAHCLSASRREGFSCVTPEGQMPSLTNLRILIADDHAVTRGGLRDLLSSRPGWTVCAEAATGREAVGMAELYRPDIVVMDIVMPELSGLEATRRIRRLLPRTEVLVLSLHYSDELVRKVMDAGARGYVLKSDASKDLVSAIRAVANHQSYFTSSAKEVLIRSSVDQNLEAASRSRPTTLLPVARGKLFNFWQRARAAKK